MARTQLRLGDLALVVDKMRELGIASWCNSPIGDVILGQAPADKPKKVALDPLEARRTHYTELLGRKVTDAELEKLP